MALQPGSEEWLANVRKLAEETAVPDGGWWYFSFADPTLPQGSQFLGACYVRGGNLPDAITRSHALGINPGGEIAMYGPMPADIVKALPERFMERLMTREQCGECDDEIAKARAGGGPC